MKRPIAWRAVLGRLGLFILAFAGMAAIAVTPVATVLDEWATANPTYARLYFDITGALAIFAATWVMTTFLDRRPFPTIGFAPQHVGRDLSRGLAIGTAWLGISVGLTIVAGWASPQNPTGLSGSLLLIAAASALFNVLTQQLLLCGYVLQTISP